MNTSITSEFEYAHTLLTLLETYDDVDISGISTICGSNDQVKELIQSGNFIGISSSSYTINGTVDDEDINYFNSLGLTIKWTLQLLQLTLLLNP